MSSTTAKWRLYTFHPKILEQIGKTYAMRYRTEGKDAAQAWAYWFLPTEWMEKAIPYMKEAMKKAGIKVKSENPDPGNLSSA